MDGLTSYYVGLYEVPGGVFNIYQFWAEDDQHAREQGAEYGEVIWAEPEDNFYREQIEDLFLKSRNKQ